MDLGVDRVFHEHGQLTHAWADERFSVVTVLGRRSLDDGLVTIEISHPKRGQIGRIRHILAEWAEPREALTDFSERHRSWVVVAVPNCLPGEIKLDEFFNLGRELFEAIHTRVYGSILIAQAKGFQTHLTESG